MDLKQLSYFVRVAELGSFTRAAAALDIAQPALSRQVRLLEVELRQTLLVRNGRGVTLTEGGKVLLEHGRGVLHQVERLREELSKVRGSLSGRVALGLPPTLARVLTVPIMRRFQRELPDASLTISEGLSTDMNESLMSGRLDIALLYNAQPSADIELRSLVEQDLFLVQRKEDNSSRAPVKVSELPNFPLIIPSRPHAIRVQVETLLINMGLQPKIALEIDGITSILDLVADGAGCAILPHNAVLSATNPAAYNLRPISSPGLRSKLFIATNSRRPATSTQQAMLELLERTVKETLIGDKLDPQS